MSRSLTASDRKSLIRLASSLPVGDEMRRSILSGLLKMAEDKVKVLNENGREVWVSRETLKGPDGKKFKPVKEKKKPMGKRERSKLMDQLEEKVPFRVIRQVTQSLGRDLSDEELRDPTLLRDTVKGLAQKGNLKGLVTAINSEEGVEKFLTDDKLKGWAEAFGRDPKDMKKGLTTGSTKKRLEYAKMLDRYLIEINSSLDDLTRGS